MNTHPKINRWKNIRTHLQIQLTYEGFNMDASPTNFLTGLINMVILIVSGSLMLMAMGLFIMLLMGRFF